ncbi:glycine cleavage system aminomethyltransferase GcvT [Paremcibacter congregatus]|uniref:aminomethyltransferase n=1 Tax=Paremcibacter congregatus TaxID=2043170 RepID=A0A2G4YLQ8_9PROT|nr:glycine cleavage system aminomethyltransferase GcvT [Paremcibacter congregatus]PHZ83240.1 glycine cleavage system protein T [Paremcibacter congregatus]QDE28289.1 glycine cleavage system aminomethyltransferase GcvT [Paremcibacter congregatus]
MSTDSSDLLKTPLCSLHEELGGKMVPFAGYLMPVQYPLGVMGEHNHTRSAAGLFDVSHMGQVVITGEHADRWIETLVPGNIVDLDVNAIRYSMFTNDKGGILDDLMITKRANDLFLVVNAACKEQDIAHMRAHLPDGFTLTELTDRALVALQGPKAAEVLARFAKGGAEAADEMDFMTYQEVSICGADCYISRSGYTGEDGHEISIPADQAEEVCRALLGEPEVEAIGLGARDSLRLEAGLCLYGHDLTPETTPVEASLLWAISKRRREEGGFPGADIILGQIASKDYAQKRVGILPTGRAPAREGTEILDADGAKIGTVTSGGFGPTFGGPVAMGYVNKDFSAPDTEIFLSVRGKQLPARVAKTPFVPQRYFRKTV